jgi:hypothetical protein
VVERAWALFLPTELMFDRASDIPVASPSVPLQVGRPSPSFPVSAPPDFSPSTWRFEA